MNKKDEGFCQYVLAIIVVLVLVLLILYSFSMRKIALQKQEIEDGITASALASAIIDKNEYGTYMYIRSNNGRGTGTLTDSKNEWGSAENNLLNIFKKNLATNLNLDPTTLVANEGSIIDGEVKVVRFWVYNKELVEVRDADNKPVKIKDYQGRWINKHKETDKWIIYKYDATPVGGYSTTTETAVKEADGFVYTPHDDNIISLDGGTGTGTDGAGGGHIKVEYMTIYATIEFYVSPFGYGLHGNAPLYEDPDGAQIDDVQKIKITKSVVVDVSPALIP